MTIKQFIEKAIEGGATFQGVDYSKHSLTVDNRRCGVWAEKDGQRSFIEVLHAVLRPSVWKAVGSAEGWKGFRRNAGDATWALYDWESDADSLVDMSGIPEWQWKMHAMIDHLCNGGTVESYLETL